MPRPAVCSDCQVSAEPPTCDGRSACLCWCPQGAVGTQAHCAQLSTRRQDVLQGRAGPLTQQPIMQKRAATICPDPTASACGTIGAGTSARHPSRVNRYMARCNTGGYPPLSGSGHTRASISITPLDGCPADAGRVEPPRRQRCPTVDSKLLVHTHDGRVQAWFSHLPLLGDFRFAGA